MPKPAIAPEGMHVNTNTSGQDPQEIQRGEDREDLRNASTHRIFGLRGLWCRLCGHFKSVSNNPMETPPKNNEHAPNAAHKAIRMFDIKPQSHHQRHVPPTGKPQRYRWFGRDKAAMTPIITSTPRSEGLQHPDVVSKPLASTIEHAVDTAGPSTNVLHPPATEQTESGLSLAEGIRYSPGFDKSPVVKLFVNDGPSFNNTIASGSDAEVIAVANATTKDPDPLFKNRISKLGVQLKNIASKIKQPKTEEQEMSNERCENLDRRNFGPLREIPGEDLKNLLLSWLDPRIKLTSDDVCILKRTEGSFNHVVMLQITKPGHFASYVIKIPAHCQSWTDGDQEMMLSESNVLQYIRRHTTIPVPEVVVLNETSDSELGYPYLIMKKLPGQSASKIWYDHDSCKDKDVRYLNSDEPSAETVKKRVTFLNSLAGMMAQLQGLTFDKAGLPVFDEETLEPAVGRSWHWNNKTGFHEGIWRDAIASSAEFFAKAAQRNAYDPASDVQLEAYYPESPFRHRGAGIHKIMEMVFSAPVFASSKANVTDENDTFVLRHDDLNLHNILTDEDGNVTGIVDWDTCLAVPRCIGAISMPLFLRKDWLTGHVMKQAPFMSFSHDRWRKVYSDAALEACPDGRYTWKSTIYQTAFGVLYEGYSPLNFVNRLLKSIPGFQFIDRDEFLSALGKGPWPAAEKALADGIKKLLEPDTIHWKSNTVRLLAEMVDRIPEGVGEIAVN